MEHDFYMVRVVLDSRLLVGAFARRGLPVVHVDAGYLVHSCLGETFGDNHPQPFAVTTERGPLLDLLAYSSLDGSALARCLKDHCRPSVQGVIQPEEIVAKRMPDSFAQHLRFHFKVRLCPVVRKARGSKGRQPGSEVDVFLDAAEQAGPGHRLDRRDVYVTWAKGLLEQRGGLRCTGVRLERMVRTRFLRRDAERSLRVVERPDISVSGSLEILDAAVFHAMVRQGVGRHRAFGFGMLLLKRAA